MEHQPTFFTKAVRLAQGAGYDVTWDEHLVCYIGHSYDRCLTNKEIYSDRLFWVNLGKAMGWSETQEVGKLYGFPEFLKRWQFEWHRFVDHLAEEKDPEEFFEKILA